MRWLGRLRRCKCVGTGPNAASFSPHPIAPWELRVGVLRVFYEVASEEPEAARAEFRSGKTLSFEEMKRETSA